MNKSLLSAQTIHFTGIKGVGMTAAALCTQDLGIKISGSDIDQDFVTHEVLSQRGITPSIGFSPDNVPNNIDALVYTGAHDGINNPEVKTAKDRGIPTYSQAQMVGQLMKEKIGVSVCGVGGKTTTSAMITNILEYANLDPSFLIGVGKILNLQVPGRYSLDSKHFIAEADEYANAPGTDNSPRFIYQYPEIIVCTNVVHDHPDIYPDLNTAKKAFQEFFNHLNESGKLVANIDSPALKELVDTIDSSKVVTFGESETASVQITGSFVGQDMQMISIIDRGEEINFTLPVPGIYNARNAVAAYITGLELGLDRQVVIEGLQLFRGSMRRFEKVGNIDNILYYDDYAHHPTQVSAVLKAARQWLPLNRIITVFQPHTFSRTKVLFDEFSKSFTHADHVIITDIFASARESADDSISGESLAQAIRQHHEHVDYVPQSELANYIKNILKPGDALLTLGAGDIYHIHDQLGVRKE